MVIIRTCLYSYSDILLRMRVSIHSILGMWKCCFCHYLFSHINEWLAPDLNLMYNMIKSRNFVSYFEIDSLLDFEGNCDTIVSNGFRNIHVLNGWLFEI